MCNRVYRVRVLPVLTLLAFMLGAAWATLASSQSAHGQAGAFSLQPLSPLITATVTATTNAPVTTTPVPCCGTLSVGVTPNCSVNGNGTVNFAALVRIYNNYCPFPIEATSYVELYVSADYVSWPSIAQGPVRTFVVPAAPNNYQFGELFPDVSVPPEFIFYRFTARVTESNGCNQYGWTSQPQFICRLSTATVTTTPIATPTITSTPGNEPEWAILQHAVSANPDWFCGAIYGTPGHRTVGCYTGAGHSGVGSVDNYGDPASASANWLQRRANAQASYPVFRDISWNGYPGYHAEGPMPPYGFFTQEDFYWADVRVLGGTRVDDTHFRYSPDIATAIMSAAETLGYLPTPSATPTSFSSVTPSATPTYSISSTPISPSATPASCVVQFVDVPQGHTFYDVIRCLACRGVISGYADGTYRPNNLVTRGQLAKIVSNAAGYAEDPPQIFEDVPPSNAFYEWINRLAIRGHMSGYVCGGVGEPCTSGMPYFRPFANATRGQTSKIVANAAEYVEEPAGQTFEDVTPTHTFYREIQRLASRNIMQGYVCGGAGEPCVSGRPYFRPQNNVTRGQSAKIVANTFYPGCETP